MKLRYSLIALALIAVPLAGTATAGNGKVDSSLVWIDLTPVGGPFLYLSEDGQLWQERNDVPGLQQSVMSFNGDVRDPDIKYNP